MMKKEKSSVASIAANQYIDFGLRYSGEKNILIIGNFDGLFGKFKFDQTRSVMLDYGNVNPKTYDNLRFLIEGLQNGCRFDFIHNECGTESLEMLSEYLQNSNIGKSKVTAQIKHKAMQSDAEYLEFINKLIENNMKFDYIIQNPPYSGSLHLEFLKKGLELLKEKSGKMTIIEPATWLINVRKNGKAKLYDEIKEMIKGHVSKVVIENLCSEFKIMMQVPFSICYIDFSQNFKEIEYHCCGEKHIVKSLYDCNLIGNYEKIHNILNKINDIEKVKNHIYIPGKSEKKEGNWYCKYSEILKTVVGNQAMATLRGSNCYEWESFFKSTHGASYAHLYTTTILHFLDDKISSSVQKTRNRGAGKDDFTDKDANCITGTRQELENWKHFVFNNKLPLFINIVMTIDQNNNSLDYVPWLVDKQYTDEEIAKLFDFTQEELDLIDHTLKKFERYSPWFKRYMCGKDSVTNEEVQKFIDSI